VVKKVVAMVGTGSADATRPNAYHEVVSGVIESWRERGGKGGGGD